LKFQKHIKAGHGVHGTGQLKTGAEGEDKIIEVPLGTIAKDGETGEVLFEISEDGEKRILVPGGRGGKGNSHFKSSTNRAPQFAQPGEPGQEAWMILELKILADVGLVGYITIRIEFSKTRNRKLSFYYDTSKFRNRSLSYLSIFRNG
jgi:GTP-binding protein